MRNDQLIRQWSLLSLLENTNGKTQQSLARDLSCSVRTIQRDLQTLTTVGFPITYDVRGHQFYWYLPRHFAKIRIPFTTTELLALTLAKNFYALLPVAILRTAFESAMNKIEKAIPAAKNLAILSTRAFGTKNYNNHWSYLQIISDAIKNRTTLSLSYYSYSKKELSTREVDPYDLWHSQETIYLIGYCHLRKGIRLFALERITNAEMTSKHFTIHENYSLDEFTRKRFRVMQEDPPTTIRIWFHKRIADYVKDRLWHPSQKIEQQKDGSIILTMEAAGSTELLHWILGYGANAEVLEPQSLRQLAAQTIAAMNQIYSKRLKRPEARSEPDTSPRKKIRAAQQTAT